MFIYKKSFIDLFLNYRKELFINLEKVSNNKKKNRLVYKFLNFFFSLINVLKHLVTNYKAFNAQNILLNQTVNNYNSIIINGDRDLASFILDRNLNEYFSKLFYSKENLDNKLSSLVRDSKFLLIFDSGFFSPLWASKNLKNIIIIDDVFLIFLFIRHPKNLFSFIYSFFKNIKHKINLVNLASNFYEVSLVYLKSKLNIKSCIMTTSNSFKIEFYRYYIPKFFELDNIYEITHGIPDAITEDYINQFYKFNDINNLVKLNLTFQIPNLKAHNINKNVRSEDYYINLSFNKHLIKNNFSKDNIIKNIEKDFFRIFKSNIKDFNGLIITYFGGVPFNNDIIGSGMLNKEMDLCNKILRILDKKIDCKIIYFPHPSISSELVKNEFKDYQIYISKNTFLGFYLSDLCISYYSSTLWEAKFFDCQIFSPVLADQSLFSDDIMSYIKPDIEIDLSNSLKMIISEKNSNPNLQERLEKRINKILF